MTTQDRYDLSKLQGSQLPESPSELWLLDILEMPIVVRDKFYLPVVLSSYYLNSAGHRIGDIWSPPYVGTKLPFGPVKFSQAAAIQSEFTEFEKKEKAMLDHNIQYALYHLGISSYKLTFRRSLLELKRSAREPTQWKAYYARCHLITPLDYSSLLNLVDPEGLRGIHLLPLQKTSSDLIFTDSQDWKVYYRGKPLSSNLAVCYSDGSTPKYRESASVVQESLLGTTYLGGMFSIDVIGFGTFGQYVKSSHSTLTKSGKIIFADFLIELQAIFTDSLFLSRIYMFQLRGDGFIAASPYTPDKDNPHRDFIDSVIVCLKTLITKIRASTTLSKLPLCVRVGIMGGTFYFGKIGADSLTGPHLLGSDWIDVIRLMDAMPVSSPDDHSEYPLIITCQDSEGQLVGDALTSHGIHHNNKRHVARSKEFESSVTSFYIKI